MSKRFGQTNEQQRHLYEKLISEMHRFLFNPVKKYFFLPLSRNGISSLMLGLELSCLLSVNITCRVLMLQDREMYRRTLLILEMDKETFFKRGEEVVL